MKTTLSTILMLYSCCLIAQLEWNVCPENTYCINGVYETSFWFPASNVVEPPIELCDESLPAGQVSMRFEAVSSYLEVLASYGGPGDDYASVGIKESCEDGCIVWQTCGQNGVDFETNELVPGREYIFYFSGCNGHIGFDVHILRLTEGPNETNFSIQAVELAYQEECSFGESDFCCSEDLYLRIETEDPEWNELLQNKEGIWRIELEGEISTEMEAEDLYSFDFCSLPYGDYILTLKEFEYVCGILEYDLSYEFSIIDVTENFGEGLACMHELESSVWKPDDWKGEPIEEAGDYHHVYINDCNCPVDQYVSLTEYEEEYIEYELELCPDDYPYEFFDNYELDYNQYDYDIMLRFDGESLVEDIDGSDCDSLIHLFVINENPEDRCSSCELPVSLENSKIIYCVPFDNGTYDVSGKANRIYPVGVGYDNNGPANNPLWEAEFDGRDDHVWIPHMEDLNTSVFAFDLEFRKEGDFENGEPEVLISKGDLTEANRRFDITLEEKTETSYDLKANCYTDTETISIEVPDLNIGEWYGTTMVVDEDSISVYLNGILFETKMKSADLRGNDLNMYLATEENAGELTNFFDGRLDDFKYWKQKLSGQDILYLYYPEKEFEVNIDMFLRCCESGIFREIEIGENNPNDTLIIAGASVTGYDSVYYLNMIPIDDGPSIDQMLIPEDIVIQRSVDCGESCSQLIEWEEPPMEVFSDLCGITTIESTHQSPVLLDESVSFVEVEYIATNECGNISSYSFTLELQCDREEYYPIPQEAELSVSGTSYCFEGDSICAGNYLFFEVLFQDSSSMDLENYEDLSYIYSINGETEEVQINSDVNLIFGLVLEELGEFTVCLEQIESSCDLIEFNVCQQFTVFKGYEIDHGTIVSCPGSLMESAPPEMSYELIYSIMASGESGYHEIIWTDPCQCQTPESVWIEFIEEPRTEQVYNVCEEDLPIEILGQEFYSEIDQEEFTFMGGSEQMDPQGNLCDSTIVLTINIYESETTEVYAQLCEGESVYGYNQSGSYTDVFVTENGCDSIRHIEVLVLENNVEELEIEICPDEVYNGYTMSGLYEENYINSDGCDSTIFIQLTVLEEDHEDCIMSSVDETELSKVLIYPNPVDAILTIESQANLKSISLFDTAGKKIIHQEVKNLKNTIDLNQLLPGLYFIVVESNNSEKKIEKLIVN